MSPEGVWRGVVWGWWSAGGSEGVGVVVLVKGCVGGGGLGGTPARDDAGQVRHLVAADT